MNLMNIKDFIMAELFPSFLWKECQPKILIVTDGLNYSTNDDFGLTQFISTLANTPIHGMMPQIIKASRGNSVGANITNFQFNDVTNGILKSRYDVVFIFAVGRENVNQLPQTEIDAITKFMQAGGGVFATGDHEDLGAAICRDIPRVRSLRFWKASETPNIGNTTRLSTNLSGANNVEDFDDQSDTIPQTLYLNFRTQAGGIGNAHPVLQGGNLGNIEVFPDHPHEGECRVPVTLGGEFVLNNEIFNEFPNATAGGSLFPEVAAMSMSHGTGFPGKFALAPRSFASVVAYDGQRAEVGRIVTDATWHHFVNVNLDGTGSGKTGLQQPAGTDTLALTKIRKYYTNLATWLMPKKVRKCLRDFVIIKAFTKFPLFEELKLVSLKEANADQLTIVGEQVFAALSQTHTKAEVQEMVADVLEDAMGDGRNAVRFEKENVFENELNRKLGMIVFGAVVTGIAETLISIQGKCDVDVHKTFGVSGVRHARLGFKIASEELVGQITQIQEELLQHQKLLRDAA